MRLDSSSSLLTSKSSELLTMKTVAQAQAMSAGSIAAKHCKDAVGPALSSSIIYHHINVCQWRQSSTGTGASTPTRAYLKYVARAVLAVTTLLPAPY